MGRCLLSRWNGVGDTFGYRPYMQEEDRSWHWPARYRCLRIRMWRITGQTPIRKQAKLMNFRISNDGEERKEILRARRKQELQNCFLRLSRSKLKRQGSLKEWKTSQRNTIKGIITQTSSFQGPSGINCLNYKFFDVLKLKKPARYGRFR